MAKVKAIALIMVIAILFSVVSMAAAFMDYGPDNVANECVSYECCENMLYIRDDAISVEDVEPPIIELPIVDGPELEDGYNPYEQPEYEGSSEYGEYGEYEPEELCECECECECEYYEYYCICECECEDGYIGIMPLVNSHAGLQTAINNIPANSSGTITLTGSINMTGTITINQGRNVTINGNGHSLIHTGTSGRHFTVASGTGGTLNLNNVTLTAPSSTTINRGGITINNGGAVHMNGDTAIIGNRSFSGGGGVAVWGGTLTMHSGRINGNSGSHGGGVCVNFGGHFTMHAGEISGNDARSSGGGGVLVHGDETFIMNGGVISYNTGNNGGGVHNIGTFTMNNGTIRNNTASSNGGGVHNTGTFTMSNNSTIRDNTGNNGGGVNSNNTFTMHNGTISGNTAHVNGGGINASGGTTTIINATISGNRANGTATVNGGGGLSWTTAVNLTNVTVAPAVTFANNTAATGLRINDQLNLTHNINANGRINPANWTYVAGNAYNTHAFNNHDIRTATAHIIPVYRTVTFNLHGGTGNFPAQTVRSGTTATAPTTEPTRELHTFVGWYTQAEGGVPFDFNAPIIADTVVHARWVSYRTVTFDLHGGIGDFPAQVIPHNTTATAPTAEPTQANHVFMGWYTQAEGGVPFDFSVPIIADTVVHARWVRYHIVTFELHGGAGEFPAQTVLDNTTAIAPTAEPTRANYIFAGWYTLAEDGIIFDFNTPITADITIHAIWEPIYRYIRVYYVIDNEVEADIVINPKMSDYPMGYTYRAGSDFVLTGSRAIDRNTLQSDNEYVFEGWYVLVGVDFHPDYLNFNTDALSGSFVVPAPSAGGLALSLDNGFIPSSDIDVLIEAMGYQITLFAVWSIYEAAEVVTPPAGGALPATGIESNAILWSVLLSLTTFVATGIMVWIAKNKVKANTLR